MSDASEIGTTPKDPPHPQDVPEEAAPRQKERDDSNGAIEGNNPNRSAGGLQAEGYAPDRQVGWPDEAELLIAGTGNSRSPQAGRAANIESKFQQAKKDTRSMFNSRASDGLSVCVEAAEYKRWLDDASADARNSYLAQWDSTLDDVSHAMDLETGREWLEFSDCRLPERSAVRIRPAKLAFEDNLKDLDDWFPPRMQFWRKKYARASRQSARSIPLQGIVDEAMESLIALPEPAKVRIKAREAEAEEQFNRVRRACEEDVANARNIWGGYFDLHRDNLRNAIEQARAYLRIFTHKVCHISDELTRCPEIFPELIIAGAIHLAV